MKASRITDAQKAFIIRQGEDGGVVVDFSILASAFGSTE